MQVYIQREHRGTGRLPYKEQNHNIQIFDNLKDKQQLLLHWKGVENLRRGFGLLYPSKSNKD